MKRLAAALLLLSVPALAAGDELLEDPGFELATSGGQQSNSAWVLSVNFPNGVDAAAQFQTAGWASNPNGTPGTGVWLKSWVGAVNPGEDAALAEIRQDVAGAQGVQYTAFAWYKEESNYTSDATLIGISFLDGSMNVLSSSTLDVHDLHPGDGSWIQYSVDATAPAGTAVVRVFGQMIDGVLSPENPQSAFFDDFSLTGEPPTPVEAASWGRLKRGYR